MNTSVVPVQAIKTLFSRMRVLGLQHCLEVYPEKGSWVGEDSDYRIGMTEKRLDFIGRLRRGEPVPPNDDGSPRTLESEYGKLVCSVAILGEDIGVCRGIS